LSGNIAGQALVASLQKILGPFVIQVLGDAFSPRKPSKTMPIFSSALYCLCVLRLMSFMMGSDDERRPAGFCFISTPLVKMNKDTHLNHICPIGADVRQFSPRAHTLRWRTGVRLIF
jgi:hypothetical protein